MDAECRRRNGDCPNTEIDFVLIEDGPRAGDYLISAETVDRLPEFYEQVKHLPYKPGPAKELNDTYRAMSSEIGILRSTMPLQVRRSVWTALYLLAGC